LIAAGPAGAVLSSGVGFEVLALPWLTRPSQRAGGVRSPRATGISHARASFEPLRSSVRIPSRDGRMAPAETTSVRKGRDMSGFLKKKCQGCGEMIYIKTDADGVARPYKSWVAGQVSEGEWVLHDCRARSQAGTFQAGARAARPQVRAQVMDDPLLRAVKRVAANYHVSEEVAVSIVGTVVSTMKESEPAFVGSAGG
jgi:hypothetical protein